MAVGFGMIVILIPACAVIGIILVTLGFRGRPVFTMPSCARCKYDLRAMNFMSQDIGVCPECGAALGDPNAVTFGKARAQKGKVFLGIALVAMPWLLLIPISILQARARAKSMVAFNSTGPNRSKSLSNAALIAGLPKTGNEPWDWQELEARLNAGSLSNSEADAAIGGLTSYLNNQHAAGKSQEPLHWAGNFLERARAAGSVSKPTIQKLCEAFYFAAPSIRFHGRVRSGAAIDFNLAFQEPWNLPKMRAVWALRQVTAEDGSTLVVRSAREGPPETANNADRLSGMFNYGDINGAISNKLPPGEHELSFTFDLGTITEQSTLRGLDGKPGTIDKWPTPIATWQMVIKQKVTIVAPDSPVVGVVTDPAQDPFRTMTLGVEQALARPSSRGVDIIINWKIVGAPNPPLSYRVTLLAGDQKIDLGGLVIQGQGGQRSSQRNVKTLAVDVTSFDILLTPDVKTAEQFIGLDSIWGGEHKIENVPLERADLPK